MMFQGLLIKESLEDERLLDLVQVQKVELWATDNRPKYWTAITFTSGEPDFPEQLSRALMGGGNVTWYVDFARNGIKYIVLRGHVLTYPIGDAQAKKQVMDRCLALGVPIHQLDWEETL